MTSAGHPPGALVEGKLRPPPLLPSVIDRPRLTARLDAVARVGLVVAPPGFGKTMLVRQWFDTTMSPKAWLSLDLLDRTPFTFWRHFLRAVQAVFPDVDDEAEAALVRYPDGDEFLTVLLAHIEDASRTATVVLDDLSRLTSPQVTDRLALLVERVGDRLRLMITARTDPRLPIVNWRTARWVTDVREDDLRVNDDEAMQIAATFGPAAPARETITALNHRVDGWPIALALSLEAAREAVDHDAEAIALVRSDRLLSDYLVAEVLDRLPRRHREVLLALSVVEWFDEEIGARLAGEDAAPVIADLVARRTFLTESADGSGSMRFHPLVRNLLEGELKWRYPTRHADLHRLAAELSLEANDVVAAYRHLVAAGDVGAAQELVVAPAIELVTRADHRGLKLMMGNLPGVNSVDDPSMALDVAFASICAQDDVAAAGWCDRADSLVVGEAPALRTRVHGIRAVIALHNGDIESSAQHISEFEHLLRRIRSEMLEQRLAPVAARHALATGELPDARRWLDRVRGGGPSRRYVSPDVSVLEAWYDLAGGRLRRAAQRAEQSCAQFRHGSAHPHPWEVEALVVSAWCLLGAGELERARQRVESARIGAAEFGQPWKHIRAGTAWAYVRYYADGPNAAMAAIDDVRFGVRAPVSDALLAPLRLLEARSLVRLGRLGAARRVLDDAAGTPESQLVRAEIVLAAGLFHEVDSLLTEAAAWALPWRLEAAVLKASADAARGTPGSLAASIEEGAASGWVSPFLGHGPRSDELVRREPLDRLHPALARRLTPLPARGRSTSPAILHLTARELSILSLLPSHLTYAQIGDELFLSINTVKSNLKSVYRKLDVVTRAEAVDIARQRGLV